MHPGFVSRELFGIKTIKKTLEVVSCPLSHIKKKPILLLQWKQHLKLEGVGFGFGLGFFILLLFWFGRMAFSPLSGSFKPFFFLAHCAFLHLGRYSSWRNCYQQALLNGSCFWSRITQCFSIYQYLSLNPNWQRGRGGERGTKDAVVLGFFKKTTEFVWKNKCIHLVFCL